MFAIRNFSAPPRRISAVRIQEQSFVFRVMALGVFGVCDRNSLAPKREQAGQFGRNQTNVEIIAHERSPQGDRTSD
jgi:hypothetical protein